MNLYLNEIFFAKISCWLRNHLLNLKVDNLLSRTQDFLSNSLITVLSTVKSGYDAIKILVPHFFNPILLYYDVYYISWNHADSQSFPLL